MKQYLIAITLLLTLATTTQAAAQKHRHSATVTAPAAAPVAPVTNPDTTGIEAFSDTTDIADDDSLVAYTHPNVNVNISPADLDGFFNSVDWDNVTSMFFVVCVVAIIFLLSPLLIIALIFYFVNKNRKDRLKLAQMAIQHGQPIPDPLIHERPVLGINPYRSGITQICLGIGLMVFLGMIIGKLGFGIGALVFFIGLGKLIIALLDNQSQKRDYTFTSRQNTSSQSRQTPPPVDNAITNFDNKEL